MALTEVKIPDIGDSAEVEVIEILVSAGDSVLKEDPILTLESDKATMEIPAPADGIVMEIKVAIGDKVSEGALVMMLEAAEGAAETPAEAAPAEQPPAKKAEQPAPAAAPVEAPAAPAASSPPESLPPPPVEKSSGALPHASPAIRRFARQLGANLTRINGTGPKGRILKDDVRGWIKQQLSGGGAAAADGAGIPLIPAVDFSRFGEIELLEMSRIKKLSGPHLQRAWLNVPHVTQNDEVDITELEAFRQSIKPEAEKQGARVTMIAFVMKLLVEALKKFTNFNASIDPDGAHLILKKYYNIGIAVDTPNGLVVPVIKDVDQKGIFDLAREMGEISGKARDGKLSPGDMQGGCMSISNLGGIGGTSFTPIVNAPEVAILGLSRAKMQPVWDGQAFQPRLILPLSLSYDHRAIDGAEGARFCACLAQLLSDPRRTLL